MYTLKNLDGEISNKAEKMVTNGEVPKNWLIVAILNDHTEIEGDDAQVALCCMRETVANRVNKYFAAIKATQEEKPQLPLPGFKRLQRRYVIKRNNEQTIVSVYKMSDQEINNKADEMDAMAAGCAEHANELRRFKEQRQQSA